ncbi:Hypothetical protein CINCED_3A006711 [Cinara cedri]|uniref:Uncharacterized protein n=1 Tax=Cinara cedri TaxID=506608 RepID=A0A5E4NKJ0_9HEMI|nr:Hypothetical protein CINCED_3A006711 [Cinara cedri]
MAQFTAVCALAVFLLLATGCLCRPQSQQDFKQPENSAPTSPTNRASRLQKPTQVLNTGFDEIVVESNLQVHNRVGSKTKSKIMLQPSNSNSSTTNPQNNKSAKSLQVA